MNSEWETLTLADVCRKITDGAHASPQSVTNGMPMASVKDLTPYGINLSNARHISPTDYKILVQQGCKPEVGDVLIAKDGNSALDTVCTVDHSIDVVLLSSVAILRPDLERLNSGFLKYYFSSNDIVNYLKTNFISGAAIPRIVLRDFRKAEINLPPLNVQKKVVEILGSIDQKIQINQEYNQTLESIAQTIFKSWFVDFNPVHAKIRANSDGRDPNRAAMATISGVSMEQGWDEIDSALDQKLTRMTDDQRQQLIQVAKLFPDELVKSEIGVVPKGWRVEALDGIADFLNGHAMQKYPPESGKSAIPVLKIAQLRKGNTEGADIATAEIPEKFKVIDGDVIFSWSGSLMVKIWAGGNAALNQHLFKVTSNKYDQWFYYHWTKHHLDSFIRIAESKAVTMGHIKRSHLREAKCAIPRMELLEFGKQNIEQLLKQSLQLKLESRSLKDLRDTLLPKLISGEIEINKIYNSKVG